MAIASSLVGIASYIGVFYYLQGGHLLSLTAATASFGLVSYIVGTSLYGLLAAVGAYYTFSYFCKSTLMGVLAAIVAYYVVSVLLSVGRLVTPLVSILKWLNGTSRSKEDDESMMYTSSAGRSMPAAKSRKTPVRR
jgi:uncharacterized membrane protein